MTTGRLAPSPTGLLHLGNVRSLALAWLAARSVGGRIYLRVEDLLPGLDEHVAPLLDDLAWLGLDCDPAPPDPCAALTRPWWKQSERAALYTEIVSELLAAGLAYPCVCTRKDIELAALAPHAEDLAAAYPGTCAGRFASLAEARAFETTRAQSEGRPDLGVAVRVRVPAGLFAFDDLCRGPQTVDVQRQAGDLVVQRKDGGCAYMLAVVVDDLAMGVDQVVRGDDLLDVTGQQLAIRAVIAGVQPRPRASDAATAVYRAARAQCLPAYAHVPLVHGADGRRLAKRNQSLHVRQLRAGGVSAGTLVAWVLRSVGLAQCRDWAHAARQFDWATLPRGPVVLDGEALAELAP